ncbi:MAG: hypothetical protein M3177_05080 [Pseudomonadota bacterium]|nr:hypothetical protein [Pseudomonadota bacterium]
MALHSTGGLVDEADQIASVVRSRRLTTYVEVVCSSACTLILIAGTDRAATPNAQIGFHRPTLDGKDEGPDSPAQNLYRAAGIGPRFTDRVFATPAASMWYPSFEEMLTANVLTRRTLGGETTAVMSSVTSRDEVLQALSTVAFWPALNRRYPDVATEVIDTIWGLRSSGLSDNEIMARGRAVLGGHYPRILAGASDEQLERFWTLVLEQTQAARDVSYQACSQSIEGQLNASAVLPRQLTYRELALADEILRSPERSYPAIGDDDAISILEPVYLSLEPEQLNYLTAEDPASTPDHIKCEAMLNFYRHVLALPHRQRGQAIRYLLVVAAQEAAPDTVSRE